ncbi:MAG: response regulator [Mediterranea massiliensis]|nr:response regulator [Mediterranea massiliensis]
MKIFHAILTTILLSLCSVKSQAENIVFKHLTMQENLSHYSAMALYQDERGLIWIGTRNGVSVYNGNEMEIYRHEHTNPNSIQNNSIREITGDRNGHVYFLTNRGVSCFDLNKELFTTLTDKKAEKIACYENELYIATGHRILKYNSTEKTFLTYYQLPDSTQHISSFHITPDRLLIGTESHGLYVRLSNNLSLSHPITHGKISDIYQDSKQRYWIGTWEDGLYILDGTQTTHHRYRHKDERTICADFVRKFCEDKQGNIWIGTFRGLNKYIESSQTFIRYNSNEENQMTHSSIWSMICDTQGTIWFGTYFGGVNYFNPAQIIHKHFIAEELGYSNLVIGAMTEDNKKNLWICTEGDGLCKIEQSTGNVKWFKHKEEANSISHNNLKSIYYDKEANVLWIGTHMGGLNKMDVERELFTHYSISPSHAASYKSNIICDIIPHQDKLLLATHDGVYSFAPKTGKSQSLFKEKTGDYKIDFALDLLLTHDGTLWISGAEKGVYSYNFQNDSLKLYTHNQKGNSLSSNGINCLYEDSAHRLWLCSAERGVDRYRAESDDFINLCEADGLLSDCVYGAYEVKENELIFITDNGFSHYNFVNGLFRNFKANTNIPLSGINQKSIYCTSVGEIYIGGVDGMISFSAKDLEYTPLAYQIFPYKLYVNDKEIKVGDHSGILENALYNSPKITLKENQNMVSIAYCITNYLPINREKIIFRLENFSDSWSTLRNGQIITYTNLSPGEYTLVVKSDETSHTNAPISKLTIEVLPAWYKTDVAYICYFILVLSLVLFAISAYKNRLKLQAELEYERKHLQDIENLNQYKLRFFTNISHEFRTPLTLIIGQLELLLQVKSFVPSIYNKILNAYKNSLLLQSLVSELLDFRKQEQGFMKIKVRQHNIVKLLQENYQLFKEYAQTKGIEFQLVTPCQELDVWYDEKQLQKAINNLLSNSFKHTPQGGTVTLKLDTAEESANISVSDTGEGIKEDELEHIFDRFYQAGTTSHATKEGFGIGLALTKGIIELHKGSITVESIPGEGSTFTFKLPLGKLHFKPEEIENENNLTAYINPARQILSAETLQSEEVINLKTNENEEKFKALIVEDDKELALLLKEILTPYYHIEMASDGKEGLAKASESQPDIIISDIMMPGMSGIELCKKIKNDIETCHIPVLLLTARTSIEHKLEGLQNGADDYVTKPFDINILLARCRNLINNRIVLQEKFNRQPQTTTHIFATNPLDKEFMDKAMRIINQHLDNPHFNVNTFAQEMAIARTKLFVKLKAITGQTPNEFILTIRLKKAAYMLKNNPEWNISEISDKTGFSSPRYFSKCFKEKYNMAPQAYRRTDNGESAE